MHLIVESSSEPRSLTLLELQGSLDSESEDLQGIDIGTLEFDENVCDLK